MQARSELSISESNTTTAHREAVERVILEMRQRLAEPFSLDEMAKIACLSPFHFDRVFHEITGIPAVQFLYALRIEAAKRLLLTTPLSVTNVCYEVGYNSIGTFTSRFTELVGLSPRQFRRLAERVEGTRLESLFTEAAVILRNIPAGPLVTGRVIPSDDTQRLIFVGLFPSQIPQSRPIAGTLLTSSGLFSIAARFDCQSYVFAVAFPRIKDPLTYLLPEAASILVGVGNRPVSVWEQQLRVSTEVVLRASQITDPPILIALPFLLVEVLDQAESMIV